MSAAEKGRGGRLTGIVAIVIAVVVVTAVVVALVMTAQPGFYDRYTGLQRRHMTLESSAHAGIDCVVCHTDAATALGSAVARVGEFYNSLISTSTEPAFVTFQPPTSEACLQCHRYDWSDEASQTAVVPHPAHLRVSMETRDCVLCHKWVAHEELYQAKHTTMPFSAV
ncbi:MAG TPA: NapC/NirT family cytochrome c, partial [Coriobacteriia bacterium]